MPGLTDRARHRKAATGRFFVGAVGRGSGPEYGVLGAAGAGLPPCVERFNGAKLAEFIRSIANPSSAIAKRLFLTDYPNGI